MSGASWEPKTAYEIGEKRVHDNQLYKCLQTHTSSDMYTPDLYNGILWSNAETALRDDSIIYVWCSGTYYYTNTLVQFAGKVFKCTKDHVSFPFYSPAHSTTVWKEV